jgi:pyruvate/2-oxoglutarate dehydrogenase complex dihydrolipoamide dehydrogenase (E3) component
MFLPKEERDAAQLLSDSFARDGIEVRLNTEAVGVRVVEGQKHVDLVNEDWHTTVVVDAILTGTGRLPNVEGLGLEAAGVNCDDTNGVAVDDYLQTSNPRIYAAGDACLEHKFTHTADASARIVVRNALFPGRKKVSSLTIPWCTYTDPEIAHVGLYAREACARHSGQDVHHSAAAKSTVQSPMVGPDSSRSVSRMGPTDPGRHDRGDMRGSQRDHAGNRCRRRSRDPGRRDSRVSDAERSNPHGSRCL